MARKDYNSQAELKHALGALICNLRKERKLSLRKFATAIGLSPSNVTYIEKGVNVPTAEVYIKAMDVLDPDSKLKKEMDDYYSLIRNTPPPDICKILLHNNDLYETLRLIDNIDLTPQQLQAIKDLFVSINHSTPR